jgi:hypothetical protein
MKFSPAERCAIHTLAPISSKSEGTSNIEHRRAELRAIDYRGSQVEIFPSFPSLHTTKSLHDDIFNHLNVYIVFEEVVEKVESSIKVLDKDAVNVVFFVDWQRQ